MKIINISKNDFDNSQEKSILKYLLKKKIEVNFHCADGFCGMCHSVLVSGDVNIGSNAIGFTPKKEILICCSMPKSDIIIEIY